MNIKTELKFAQVWVYALNLTILVCGGGVVVVVVVMCGRVWACVGVCECVWVCVGVCVYTHAHVSRTLLG